MTLNGTTWTRVQAYSYLGAWLSEAKSWDDHVNHSITKPSIQLNLLKRRQRHFNKCIKKSNKTFTTSTSDLYWGMSRDIVHLKLILLMPIIKTSLFINTPQIFCTITQ